jgi:hypothetical protein
VAVLGYAIVYNGLSNVLVGSAAFPFGPVSVIAALVPGSKLGTGGKPAATGVAPTPTPTPVPTTTSNGHGPRGRRPNPRPRLGRPHKGPHAAPTSWQQVARRRAARRYGWTGTQWAAINSIVSSESGWNPNAVNPTSGAYGIPQILPSAHPDTHLQGDPLGQIKWLLRYIKARYGSPQAALAFRQQHGWY